MSKNQKLELTWICKDVQPKLEPRILIEDPDKSYGDRYTDNMLIHGDNLLALKALEQDFTGAIKCIYIDPPFNTGGAFANYDDNLEHSIWLSLMKDRIDILHRLLKEDGAIVVNLDDTEVAYCKVLMDEVFGRNNYITTIVVEVATPSSFKTINIGPTQTTQYLLLYAKNKTVFKYVPQYIPIYEVDLQHFSRFIENPEDNAEQWRFVSINDHILSSLGYEGKTSNSKWAAAKKKLGTAEAQELVKEKAMEFALQNCHRVFETKTLQKPSKWLHEHLKRSLELDHCIELKREGMDSLYIYKGRQIYFLGKGVRELEGEKVLTQPSPNLWVDIPTNNLKNEGGVDFPSGKKPEALLKRVIQMITHSSHDIVLDSFGGSGTTGAVAHKLRRRWIMIELKDQCHTHIQPRLKNVCDGTDQSGISKVVKWQGGGGFKYYYLAPSLLKKDHYDQWVINEEYNPTMVAAAMAKHENFRYCPDEVHYWKQGQSSEKDFIFTTTVHLSPEHLDRIHEEMKPDESLLICCKSHFEGADGRYDNISVKKIPAMLLGRCEFGRDDYSLNIIDMPRNPDEPEFVPPGPPVVETKKEERKSKAAQSGQMDIFAGTGE